jgi:hypothetical protein
MLWSRTWVSESARGEGLFGSVAQETVGTQPPSSVQRRSYPVGGGDGYGKKKGRSE